MEFPVTIERETDGRWIAAVDSLPGVQVYGSTEAEAIAKVQGLALSVVADEIAHGERDARTLLSFKFTLTNAA